MDAFAYLSVLLSIILGLAIAQVLQAYRGLLLSRARVILYALPLIWSALMLVFATQMAGGRASAMPSTTWNFAGFAIILLQTILLYMMAGVILPDVPPAEPVDLRAHYERERKPFFLISIAMLGASLAKDLVVDGRLPEGANIIFHLVFAAVSAAAILIRRPRFHELLAPAMALSRRRLYRLAVRPARLSRPAASQAPVEMPRPEVATADVVELLPEPVDRFLLGRVGELGQLVLVPIVIGFDSCSRPRSSRRSPPDAPSQVRLTQAIRAAVRSSSAASSAAGSPFAAVPASKAAIVRRRAPPPPLTSESSAGLRGGRRQCGTLSLADPDIDPAGRDPVARGRRGSSPRPAFSRRRSAGRARGMPSARVVSASRTSALLATRGRTLTLASAIASLRSRFIMRPARHPPGAAVFLRIGALHQQPKHRIRRLDPGEDEPAVAIDLLLGPFGGALPGDEVERGRGDGERRLHPGVEGGPFVAVPPHGVARNAGRPAGVAEAPGLLQRLEERLLLIRREPVVPLPKRPGLPVEGYDVAAPRLGAVLRFRALRFVFVIHLLLPESLLRNERT